MHKIAIIIYSDLEGSGKSAVYRALMTAEELLRHGDDIALVFDGKGTATLAEMLDPAHAFHHVWTKARPTLRGACSYCAKSYGVIEALQANDIPLLTDDRGHASLRALLDEGRQIITY